MKVLVSLSDELVELVDAVAGSRGRSAEIEKRLRATFGGRDDREVGKLYESRALEVPPTKVRDGGTYTGEVVKNVPLGGEKAARLEAARAAMASVQFGPTPRPPGSMLIDKGKGKR